MRALVCRILVLAAALVMFGADDTHAQFAARHSTGPVQPLQKDQPVYYQADSAEYDRDAGIVTLAGHVEIWQGGRVLRADKMTYDRNTGVAAASGHVVLLDPDGQVLFADYAELSQGMKDGVLRNMRAQLAENGRLAANGARRTDARINELSRVIYSTCNACKQNPNGPLEWDIRARSAVQDVDNKRIEYRDAVVDMFGFPVMYLPYFTHPDPSAKRASGLLVPSFGVSKYLGAFLQVPYYYVIDGATDATIAPIIGTQGVGALNLQVRHAFNNGTVTVNTSLGYDQNAPQYDLFATGQFAINDQWRWGFDIERASSVDYIRDFHVPNMNDVLTSTIYLEGFGQGSYSRLDTQAYQGLVTSIVDAKLPYPVPRYEYSFVGQPDALGGRLSLDAGAFNVLRQIGTNTQRASLSANWERPFTGAYGDLWKLVLHLDSAVYNAHELNNNPSWGAADTASAAQAMPTVALELHWPWQRTTASGGSQVIEPIAQLIAAPQGSDYAIERAPNGTPLFLNTMIPNEDSLDFLFTDANLFALNRFPGVDRLEGGPRANIGLHAAWYFASGQQLDALVGQGYRTAPDPAFPVGSGLEDSVTDIVSHQTYVPNQFLDLTAREQFDHNNLALRYVDALATVGPSWLRIAGGYLYTSYNPFTYYDTVPSGTLTGPPRNEISLNLNTRYGNWRFGGLVQRDLQLQKMIAAGASLTYEDECFIFSTNFFRRYTSINNDNGATMLVFQITLKTVGTFGFSGM